MSVAPGACECLNVIIEAGRCSQGIVPLHWTCVEPGGHVRPWWLVYCLARLLAVRCARIYNSTTGEPNPKDICVEVNAISKHAFRYFPSGL